MDTAKSAHRATLLALLGYRIARTILIVAAHEPVHFVPDLLRNTMGKVQKNILRHTYNNIYQSQA